MMKWSCLLTLFGASACTNRTPAMAPIGANPAKHALADRLNRVETPAVLFVGNSYSFGLPRALAEVAAERGKKLRVGHSTYGGWTLERHAKHDATLRKIRDGRWDVVVIQEQSQIPAMSPKVYAEKMFPAMLSLAAYASESGASPVLYQTWGRRDGDAKPRGDTFHAMNRRLRNGYNAAAQHAGGLVVVPVGDAWESEVSKGRGSSLFLNDGSHPSAVGVRLNAEVFYQTLFNSEAETSSQSSGVADQRTR
jgi:hypothetical protein